MNSDDYVVVTGAGGFIGGAVARQLLHRGFKVRALLRPSSAPGNLPPGCEVVEGDVADRDSVRRAMKGARAVFHLAANYRLWAPDPEPVLRANVLGAEIVMQEALRAGVDRIVHTSSVATLAPEGGTPANEERRLCPEKAVGAYKRSKVLSERLVERMIETEKLPAVIVCPSAPLGPGDFRPTPTGRIVREALRGAMPAYVETGLNIVHVDDVAAGHLAAFDRGVVGERYILGGENFTLHDLLVEIARVSGRRGPLVKLPAGALQPFAFANEWGARLFGYEPFLHRESLRMSNTRMFVDDSKARATLGYETRPVRLAIADAVAWFSAGAQSKGVGAERGVSPGALSQ